MKLSYASHILQALDASQILALPEVDLQLSCSLTGQLSSAQVLAFEERNQTLDSACIPSEEELFPDPETNSTGPSATSAFYMLLLSLCIGLFSNL